MRLRIRHLGSFFVVILGALSTATAREHHTYRIALGFPFPPWDVARLEGVNYDLLQAICEANKDMRCMIVDRPYSDCVASDPQGHPIIGPGLTTGRFDACVGWLITPERQRLGAEFTDAYSFGPTPRLIASDANSSFDGLGASGAIDAAKVGFLSGFFNNPTCLQGHYTGFEAVIFSGDQGGHDALLAALLAGSIDLAFWDSINTIPAGTHGVGAAVEDCGPHLATIVYPPRQGAEHRADELRRDFNCGLALIRENGTLANICANSTHFGGDPTCILEGPPPTVQCREHNQTKAGLGD